MAHISRISDFKICGFKSHKEKQFNFGNIHGTPMGMAAIYVQNMSSFFMEQNLHTRLSLPYHKVRTLMLLKSLHINFKSL
jgi:hypothetical protein